MTIISDLNCEYEMFDRQNALRVRSSSFSIVPDARPRQSKAMTMPYHSSILTQRRKGADRQICEDGRCNGSGLAILHSPSSLFPFLCVSASSRLCVKTHCFAVANAGLLSGSIRVYLCPSVVEMKNHPCKVLILRPLKMGQSWSNQNFLVGLFGRTRSRWQKLPGREMAKGGTRDDNIWHLCPSRCQILSVVFGRVVAGVLINRLV
jgi:hypothetical protein